MKAMTMAAVRRLGIFRPALLFAGCLLFAVSDRTNGVSFEQQILTAASDHYYVLYFMLPVILVSLSSYMEDDPMTVVVRYRRFSDWFLRKWASVSIVGMILIGVQAEAVLLSGAGLSSNGGIWKIATGALEDERQLFVVLSGKFNSPAACFTALLIWQCIGMSMIGCFFIWLGHFAGKRTEIIIVVLVYLYSTLWTRNTVLQKIPLTGFNHLLILHHNLIYPQRLIITICTMIACAAFMIITASFLWNRTWIARINKPSLFRYYLRTLITERNLTVLIAVIALITTYKALQAVPSETWGYWAENFFSGHGIGEFRPICFLEMLLVNLTPVYLLASFTQKAVNGQSLSVIIRAGTKTRLMETHLGTGIVFIALYLVMLLCGVLAGGAILGFGAPDAAAAVFLGKEMILKLLDIWLQFLIFLVVYYLSEKTTAGFAVLIAGNLLCILPQGISRLLPIGISSFSRFYDAFDINVQIERNIAALLIICTTLLMWLMTAGKQKMTESHEL